MFYVQYASIKRTQRTIKHHGTILWNNLCNSFPTDFAISTYKQKLKAFFLAWHSPLLFDAVVIVILFSSLLCFYIIIVIIIIIFELYSTLHLALCSCSPYIIHTCRLHELGAHKSLLQPPLSKLWFHCTYWKLLSFKLNCILARLADFLSVYNFGNKCIFYVIVFVIIISSPWGKQGTVYPLWSM